MASSIRFNIKPENRADIVDFFAQKLVSYTSETIDGGKNNGRRRELCGKMDGTFVVTLAGKPIVATDCYAENNAGHLPTVPPNGIFTSLDLAILAYNLLV